MPTPLRLALAAAIAGTSLLGAQPATVLDPDGSVYTLTAGVSRQLFPTSGSDNQVLALDITRPNQPTHRVLVPDTDGPEIESAPYLLNDSGTIFLVWQTESNAINTMLYLRSLRQGVWSAPILIYGNWMSLKSAPQLAVTRDTAASADEEGNPITVARTVLHLIWWEESDGGRVLYAPITFLNGVYQDVPPSILVLNDLDPGADSPDPRVSPKLYQTPRIQSGRADRSAVIAFANARNGHLVTVEATVMPSDLDQLAEGERAHIITGGFQGSTSSAIAEGVRAHIITGGRGGRLNSRVLNFLGDQVRAHIITGGLKADQQGAEDVRRFILGTGAELLQTGLLQASSQNSVIESTTDEASGTATASVQVRLVSSRPAPLTSNAPYLAISEDASNVVVGWQTGANTVLFCESTPTGWTPPATVALNDQMTVDGAYRLISDRVRGH